jgi:carbon-monoxide dehydrogenase large subunit
MATLVGSSIRRREDPRLLTGSATYTDDIKLPRMVYSGFVRSPYAHARLKRIDVSAARSAPGVVAVYTGADVKGRLAPVPCAWNVPDCDLKIPPHPLLACACS